MGSHGHKLCKLIRVFAVCTCVCACFAQMIYIVVPEMDPSDSRQLMEFLKVLDKLIIQYVLVTCMSYESTLFKIGSIICPKSNTHV